MTPHPRPPFLHRHGLGLVACSILLTWLVLYCAADPATHAGSFFANATADWTGVVVMVFATKYFYEIGSGESRRPGHLPRSRFRHFVRAHSLTLFLTGTFTFWLAAYLHMDPNSRWVQVVGNVVSEWTQCIGMVLLTKKLIEQGSKESAR